MDTLSRTKTGIAAAVAVALTAGGAAYAAAKHGGSSPSKSGLSTGYFVSSQSGGTPRADRGHGPGDVLAAAAGYLGVTQAELQTQLQAGKTLGQVADATSGKSKAGLIAALVASQQDELTQRITDLVNGVAGPGFGHGRRGHGPGHELGAAATYLGLSRAELRTQLQAGKTLGQIADATSGKSKAGLVAALVAAAKAELAQAVQDGRLTQAQADQIGTDLTQRLTDLVNGVHGPPPANGFRPAPGARL